VDDHTLVINKTLSLLVAKTDGQPQTLLKHGYDVLAIEESVSVEQGFATPDIIAINKQARHMLVMDCKGGANIDPGQDLRYARMRLQDLINATRPPCLVGAHTFAYVIHEEHEERIRAHTNFLLIVFGNHSVRGIGNLGHEELTQEMTKGVPIYALEFPDTDVYPFSIHDSHDHIDRQVAIGLVAHLVTHPWMVNGHLLNLETANYVLRASHPLHSSLSLQHRRALANAIKRSLGRLEQSGELGRILGMF